MSQEPAAEWALHFCAGKTQLSRKGNRLMKSLWGCFKFTAHGWVTEDPGDCTVQAGFSTKRINVGSGVFQ